MGSKRPVLETARLELRPCTQRSLASIHSMWTSSEMVRFLFDGRAISRREAKAFVEASTMNFSHHGWGLWIVTDKSTKEPAGFAGLLASEAAPNLVYGVRREFSGRGYASEAAWAVLRYCFDTLQLLRVAADVDEPNHASVRVLEKLGMARVGSGIVNDRPLLYFVAWRR